MFFHILYPRSKRNVKNVQTENMTYFCDLFPFLILREILSWMFIEQRSPFLILMLRDGLLFNIMLVTVLFLFQKLAINNTLTSKVCSCDFIH